MGRQLKKIGIVTWNKVDNFISRMCDATILFDRIPKILLFLHQRQILFFKTFRIVNQFHVKNNFKYFFSLKNVTSNIGNEFCSFQGNFLI